MSKVPETWIRKQTLVNAERYITPELKEFEEKVLGAEEKMIALEKALFEEVRTQVVAPNGADSANGSADCAAGCDE